jgi:hypothetical protein
VIPKCLTPAVQVRAAVASGKVRIVSCRRGITARPVPVTPTTANTTSTNAAAPANTVTELVPAPAGQVSTDTNATDTNATDTNATDTNQTVTTDPGTTTNGVQAPAPGHAGPAIVQMPAPGALLMACRLAARAAAK